MQALYLVKGQEMSERFPYSIEELLPHTAPMILIDQIVAHQEDFIHTIVTIHNESPFFESGGVPSYIAFEYMAQTIGIWNGLFARKNNKEPKIGFLLGSRQINLEVSSFKKGDVLNVYGKLQYNDGEMASFDCWLESDEKKIAQANLNVFQPKNMDGNSIPLFN